MLKTELCICEDFEKRHDAEMPAHHIGAVSTAGLPCNFCINEKSAFSRRRPSNLNDPTRISSCPARAQFIQSRSPPTHARWQCTTTALPTLNVQNDPDLFHLFCIRLLTSVSNPPILIVTEQNC